MNINGYRKPQRQEIQMLVNKSLLSETEHIALTYPSRCFSWLRRKIRGIWYYKLRQCKKHNPCLYMNIQCNERIFTLANALSLPAFGPPWHPWLSRLISYGSSSTGFTSSMHAFIPTVQNRWHQHEYKNMNKH